MKEPLITIVLATKNSHERIDDFLISFFSQTYVNKRLIIVDGASDDMTISFLYVIDRFIYKLDSDYDISIYDAWNRALKWCDEGWVMFMGDDDTFIDNNSLEFVACSLSSVDSNCNFVSFGCMSASHYVGVGLNTKKMSFGGGLGLCHVGTLHRYDLFVDDRFRASLKITGDYDFILRNKHKIVHKYFTKPIVQIGNSGISTRLSINYLLEGFHLYKRYADYRLMSSILWLFRQLLRIFSRNV